MRRPTVAIALAGALALPGALRAQTAEPAPHVVASATAQRSVRPDLATLTLQLNRTGPTATLAARAVAFKADSLRRALEALGIPRDSIVSPGRQSWWWWGRPRMEVIPGPGTFDEQGRLLRQDTTFRSHEHLQLRIRDLTLVGRVIDLAFAHGITDLTNLQFSATDTEAVRLEVLAEATRMARARAETAAAASGARLGRMLSLGTQGPAASRYDGLVLEGLTVSGSGRPAGQTQINEPAIQVTETVNARWELVQ